MNKTVKLLLKKVLKKILKNKYNYYKLKLKSLFYKTKQKCISNRKIMIKEKPLVSIVMAVYNREKFVGDAIKSVIDQSYENIELIVINDGSSDNSEKVIKSFNDTRIKYFYKKNSGQLDTLKFGFSKVNGDYVTRVDSDDMLQKYAIEIYVNSMLKNEQAKFAYSNLLEIDEEGNIIRENKINSFNNGKEVLRSVYKNFCSVIPDQSFWKKDYLRHVINNYIIGNVPFYIDNILDTKFVCINKSLYYYRLHNSNFVSNLKNFELVIDGIIKTIDIIVRKYNFEDYMNIDKNLSIQEGYELISERFLKEAKKYVSGIFGKFNFRKEDKIFLPFLQEANYWLKRSLKGNNFSKKQLNIKNTINEITGKNLEIGNYNIKNKRVLIVSTDNPNGGHSVGGKHIHLYLLQKGFEKIGVIHYLSTCNNNFDVYRNINDLCKKYNLDISKLKSSPDIEFLYRIYDYESQLENDIEIKIKYNYISYINCHDAISTIAAFNILEKLNLHIPIITTLHGYLTYENVDYGGIVENSYIYNFFLEYEKKAYKVSSKIITVDTRIKEYVLKICNLIKYDNIVVIKNAIDDINFSPIEENHRKLLVKKYGFNQSLVFVPRRLVPKNGVKYAVQAINYCIKKDLMIYN